MLSTICKLSSLMAALFFCTTSSRGGSYTLSGTLTDIRGNGAGFEFGEAFTATYSIADTVQAGVLIQPNRMLYWGDSLTIVAADKTLAGLSRGIEVQVFDGWSSPEYHEAPRDGYFVSAFIDQVYPTDYVLIQFDLWDYTGRTLSSLDLPSDTDLFAMAPSARVFIRRFEGGVEVGSAIGHANSMLVAIPEPATSSIWAGVVVAGLVHLRRRRRA